MHRLLIQQLQTIVSLSDVDRMALASLPIRSATVDKLQSVVHEGSRPDSCMLVIDGVFARYKSAIDDRRQLLSLHFSGDLPDLQSLHLDQMDHSIVALTPGRIGHIPHAAVLRLMDENAAVRRALVKQGLVDASITRQWLVNVGRRDALERVAHLFCECFARLRVRGLADGHSFDFLLTQSELADATGLSSVHVNRTLQQLRLMGLLEYSGRKQRIPDIDRLEALAGFDPAYLHLRADYSADRR